MKLTWLFIFTLLLLGSINAITIEEFKEKTNQALRHGIDKVSSWFDRFSTKIKDVYKDTKGKFANNKL
jgi:hypothetical protein